MHVWRSSMSPEADSAYSRGFSSVLYPPASMLSPASRKRAMPLRVHTVSFVSAARVGNTVGISASERHVAVP